MSAARLGKSRRDRHVLGGVRFSSKEKAGAHSLRGDCGPNRNFECKTLSFYKLARERLEGQHVHEKVLNITDYQESADQSHRESLWSQVASASSCHFNRQRRPLWLVHLCFTSLHNTAHFFLNSAPLIPQIFSGHVPCAQPV